MLARTSARSWTPHWLHTTEPLHQEGQASEADLSMAGEKGWQAAQLQDVLADSHATTFDWPSREPSVWKHSNHQQLGMLEHDVQVKTRTEDFAAHYSPGCGSVGKAIMQKAPLFKWGGSTSKILVSCYFGDLDHASTPDIISNHPPQVWIRWIHFDGRPHQNPPQSSNHRKAIRPYHQVLLAQAGKLNCSVNGI